MYSFSYYGWQIYGNEKFCIAVWEDTEEIHWFTPSSVHSSALSRAMAWCYPGI